jgi:hypothetical protein
MLGPRKNEWKAPSWAALGWPGVPQEGYLYTPPPHSRGWVGLRRLRGIVGAKFYAHNAFAVRFLAGNAGNKKRLTRSGIRSKVPADWKR